MNRKKMTALFISLFLAACLFAGVAAVVTMTTGQAGTETSALADSDGKKGNGKEQGTGIGDEKSAKKLIEKTVSREKIEKTVGKWEKFEMDGNGCERGVYAGKFYYKDFMIYSRTYDKGKTFHVMAIN